MTETIHFNPLTGEILETEEQIRAALKIVDDHLNVAHAHRRKLIDALTEMAPESISLPRPSRRGRQQDAVRCPRCTRYYSLGDYAA